MITISDTIEFDETKILQQQSAEFQSWLSENCLNKINDQLKPDSLDAYDRPEQYTFSVSPFTVILKPLYQTNDRSNWALTGYNILIS